jgi:crotonobetainyl-CoA:carnitine CoA-transferase CaiB-like acyl-CoA transferase
VGNGSPPLAGIRVVDATTGLAGGLATMLLADFGADIARVGGLPGDEPDAIADIYLHRGKRRVVAPRSDYRGLRAVRELTAHADILVVDGVEAEVARLGLDPTSARARHPRLIHAWLPPHGRIGRLAVLPADDLLLAAATGVADQQPSTVDRPVVPVVPVLSYQQGLLTATAIAAAVFDRLRTGRARAVAVSGLHAVAALGGSQMVDAPGLVRPYGGAKSGGVGPPGNRAFRCADGEWIFVAAYTAPMFITYVDAIDLMELMLLPGIDGDFANVRNPAVNGEAAALLERRMAERTAAQWEDLLRSVGVPAALCSDRDTWLAGPTALANHCRVTRQHPALGPVEMPNVPVDLRRTPGSAGGFAPREDGEVWKGGEADATVGAAGPVDAGLPLDGIQVLDLGNFLAAPLAAEILADFGATVVKAEQPEGDGYRVAEATYAATNRGKLNITVDLKAAADRTLLDDLVRRADVVVDNARPGVAERLGTDYNRLRTLNPGVVRATITGWGDGPLRDTRCFDPLLQAQAGLMAAQGGDGQPVVLSLPVCDVGSATAAAFGAVLALIARARDGVGQEVATSLSRISVFAQGIESTSFAGRSAPPVGGTDFPGPADTHRLYACRDGWVALRAPARERERLVAVLRLGEAGGADHLEALLARLTVDESVDLLSVARIPAVASVHRDRIMDSALLAANGFYIDVDDSLVGPVRTVGGFADWDGAAAVSTSWCHGPDEDREQVLSWVATVPR